MDNIYSDFKIRADISYELISESVSYKSLSNDIQDLLNESYFLGVCYGHGLIELNNNNNVLSEGFLDRAKANISRLGHGFNKLNPFNNDYSGGDSVDAAALSRFNTFKKKFEPLINSVDSTSHKSISIIDTISTDIERISQKADAAIQPSPTPQQAEKIIANSNAPSSLKTKIIQALRDNPGKVKFLLGAFAFGAGVSVAALHGNPVTSKIIAAIVNGIGNAALAKIQGRSTADAAFSGIGGALSGATLAKLGIDANSILSKATELGSDVAHTSTQSTNNVNNTFDSSGADVDSNVSQDKITSSPDAFKPTNTVIPATENPTSPVVNTHIPIDDPTTVPNSSEVPKVEPQGASPKDFNLSFDDIEDDKSKKLANIKKWKHALTGPEARVAADKLHGVIRKESLFENKNDNIFKLKLSKSNIVESRTLNNEQQIVLDDFLDDLAKMYNVNEKGTSAGRYNILKFLKSQGSRFKVILDYLYKYDLISKDIPFTPPSTNPEEIQITLKLNEFLNKLMVNNPEITELLLQINTKTNDSKLAIKIDKNNNVSMLMTANISDTNIFRFGEFGDEASKFDSEMFIHEININAFKSLKNRFVDVLPHFWVKEISDDSKRNAEERKVRDILAKNKKVDDVFNSIDILIKSIQKIFNTPAYSLTKELWIGVNRKGIKYYSNINKDKPSEKPISTKPNIENNTKVIRNNLTYIYNDGIWNFTPRKGDPQPVKNQKIINDLNKLALNSKNVTSKEPDKSSVPSKDISNTDNNKEKSKFDDLDIKRASASSPRDKNRKIVKKGNLGFDGSRFEENLKYNSFFI